MYISQGCLQCLTHGFALQLTVRLIRSSGQNAAWINTPLNTFEALIIYPFYVYCGCCKSKRPNIMWLSEPFVHAQFLFNIEIASKSEYVMKHKLPQNNYIFFYV